MDFGSGVIGVPPLPWHRWLLIHALELKPDGGFRFRTVLVLAARQNGKTSVVEVKNLWKMFVLGVSLVVGTAQNLDIAEESWDRAVEIAESVPDLAAEIKHIDKTNGKKALKLTSGSRWKIAAASRRGGRGLSGDDVNLDELREHHTWEAWGAVTKTTMARPKAQIWAFSNAGDDRSVVLNELQAKGRAAALNPTADLSLGLFEWSVPDDVRCDCGRPGEQHTAECMLQDRGLWAMANPALGYTITEEAIASALSTDPEEVFRTEVLCQRVESLVPEWQVIPQAVWRGLADAAVQPSDRVGPISVSAETTQDRSFSAIGVAFKTADGLMHVEVDRCRAGATWVVPRLLELRGRYGDEICALVIDRVGAASSFVDELEDDHGVEVTQPAAAEVTEAFGQFFDGCVPAEGAAPTVRHLDQPELNAAVAGAQTRLIGDRRAWDRKAGVFMPPLCAVTLAAWGWSDDGDPLSNIW